MHLICFGYKLKGICIRPATHEGQSAQDALRLQLQCALIGTLRNLLQVIYSLVVEACIEVLQCISCMHGVTCDRVATLRGPAGAQPAWLVWPPLIVGRHPARGL